MDDALTHLLIFVQAWARAAADARVGTAAGTAHGAAYDPEHAYQFGLQVVLDGLATQLPASDKL